MTVHPDQQGEPPVVLGQQCVPCGHLLWPATGSPGGENFEMSCFIS